VNPEELLRIDVSPKTGNRLVEGSPRQQKHKARNRLSDDDSWSDVALLNKPEMRFKRCQSI